MTITESQPIEVVAAKDPRTLLTPEMFQVMVDDVMEFDKVTERTPSKAWPNSWCS